MISRHNVVGFSEADLHTDIDLILNQEDKLFVRHPFMFYQMVIFQIEESAAQILQYVVTFLFHTTGIDVEVQRQPLTISKLYGRCCLIQMILQGPDSPETTNIDGFRNFQFHSSWVDTKHCVVVIG